MISTKKLADQKFLIIGGTSKAGTTAVFNYLADHPQICPSRAKETRFFLDENYPLPSKIRYQRNALQDYLSFFDAKDRQKEENWKFEATPDYLNCSNTARIIRDTLPNVRLIFILREPISRLFSWYRFGRTMNQIPLDLTFDKYVQIQRDGEDLSLKGYRHPAFHALKDGRYSLYLKPFLDLFDRSAIHVEFYDDLRHDPHAFMTSICRWADIDESYFCGYSFKPKNRSVKARRPRLHRAYLQAKQKSRQFVRRYPRLRSLLRRTGRKVNVAYRRMNITEKEEVVMSSSTRDFLSAYYKDEPGRLREMLGIEVPWPDYNGPVRIDS